MSELMSGYAGPDPAVAGPVRPYGDTTGDGMVQLSFTLPIPSVTERDRAHAEGAARQLGRRMGLEPAMVVHSKAMGAGFTFFIVYGAVRHAVDLSRVAVVERDYPLLGVAEVDHAVRSRLRRPLVLVGATVGTDAHTVGLDAILNVKGCAGEKGLEAYRELRVVNLGAQVDAAALVSRARAEAADAVLVSQVVTQRDAHLRAVRDVVAAARAAWPDGGRPLLVVGGPRFDPAGAADLGVDRAFGKGTTPREVASYLVDALTAGPAGGARDGRAAR